MIKHPLYHLKNWRENLSADEHRQYVRLSAVLAVFILAFAFNKFVLNRSYILLHVQYPSVEITLDGQKMTAEKINSTTYKITTVPGRHTVTIKAAKAINYKELIETSAGRTIELTPTLSIAPDPASGEVGPVSFINQSAARDLLYYLGENGHTATSYNLNTGDKTALSDPIFRGVNHLSWAPDHQTIILQNSQNSWYLFDFRKNNFISSDLINIADPQVTSVKYDPAHNRVGYLEYKDGAPVFGVASSGMNDKTVLTILKDLREPEFFWAPDGLSIIILENIKYQKDNLFIYSLANNLLTKVPGVENATRAVFNRDANWLLVETAETSLTHTLLVYQLGSMQVTAIGQLAVNGAAVWHADGQTITADIKGKDGTSQLVRFTVAKPEPQLYGAQLKVYNDLDAIFLNDNEDTLYFTSNGILYSFPLVTAK